MSKVIKDVKEVYKKPVVRVSKMVSTSVDNPKVVTTKELSVKQIKSELGIPLNSSATDFRVYISPLCAKRLLELTNRNNRPVSNSKVNLYLKDMLTGNWSETSTDAIGFDKDGMLVNGQHRLKALSKANKPVKMLVSFGIVPFMGMDTGKTRSISDNATMFDNCDSRFKDKKYKCCLQVIKSITRFNTGSYCFQSLLTSNDYMDLLNKYADDLCLLADNDLFSSVKVSLGAGTNRTITSASVFSAFFLAYKNGVPIDVLVHIREKLKDVTNATSYDKPILALRDILIGTVGGGREQDCVRHFCTQYCINSVMKHSKGKSCKSTQSFYTLDL